MAEPRQSYKVQYVKRYTPEYKGIYKNKRNSVMGAIKIVNKNDYHFSYSGHSVLVSNIKDRMPIKRVLGIPKNRSSVKNYKIAFLHVPNV